MGANIAPEVAREHYCEATIGNEFLFIAFQNDMPIVVMFIQVLNAANKYLSVPACKQIRKHVLYIYNEITLYLHNAKDFNITTINYIFNDIL